VIAAALATLALAGASCHVQGTGLFTGPDPACTPGRFQRLTREQVCASKDRPSTPTTVRRRVLGNYGVPGWTGANGEVDHREPVFLGGLTVAGNLWPEAGPATNNPKDELERYVRRRICTGDPEPMTVRTGRLIFLGSWVAAFRFYHLDVLRF
jgi:hypothetical protein